MQALDLSSLRRWLLSIDRRYLPVEQRPLLTRFRNELERTILQQSWAEPTLGGDSETVVLPQNIACSLPDTALQTLKQELEELKATVRALGRAEKTSVSDESAVTTKNGDWRRFVETPAPRISHPGAWSELFHETG